jgi:methylated-DNA-[protein]-cysteine S-methyltransferase
MSAVDDGAVARAIARMRDRAQREGLVDVGYVTMDTPIGRLLLAATDDGLARIAFAEELDTALVEMSLQLSPRILESPKRLDHARRQLDRYFGRKLTTFDMPIDRALIGPFARRVLDRTASIPYGAYASYSQVAREIGAPLAARAVGNALGSNPIPVVIPCHRVLRTGGSLGGYGGGLDRKRFLLELEGALPAARQ